MKIIEMQFLYFNQHQNLYLLAETEIPKSNNIVELAPGERLHWGENEHGIVCFGLWYDDPKKRPGHGGFWSSREGVVGPIIGKQLVHVAVNRMAVSMEKSRLEAILPEQYHLVENKTMYRDGTPEITWYIQRIDGAKWNETLSPPTIYASYPQVTPT